MDRILIVDDEKDNLEALQRLLRTDYDVTTATDPFDALRLIQSNPFNVIISDQRMPSMTGVELLEKAKKLTPATTRILLTGYTDVESVIDAINRGNIYRYIAKPWDPADLKITVRLANEAFLLRRELEDKNAALTASNEELKVALEQLKTLDKAKARFLSLTSHELNTPLTVLSSFVQMLAGNLKMLPADIQKAVSSIQTATDRFQEIIREVLAYVQLESGAKLELTEVAFSSIVDKTLEKVNSSIKAKKLNLVRQKEAGIFVRCEADKMTLALVKILEDAISRAPQGSTLKLDSSAEGDELLFEVSREGEPWSELSFSPLETGAQQMHHQRNLGLSLATARLVVNHHMGELELDEKKSTTLRLTLPRVKPA